MSTDTARMSAAERAALALSRVVLVTGAGASSNLAKSGRMALMRDWAGRLAESLDKAVSGSANAIGLGPSMEGDKFEENLGLFLQWREVFDLNQRFAGFGLTPVAKGTTNSTIQEWMSNNESRAKQVMESLHDSLYQNFGAQLVDEQKARDAYAALNQSLGGTSVSKICATTNYDPSLEIGFSALDYEVSYGFQVRSPLLTATFDPVGLGDWGLVTGEKRVSVLHLHGAVGWYKRVDNRVIQQPADQDYNRSLGTPVILPPDPRKDPANNALVAGIWTEFTAALNDATHVLIIGHSLHDPALVRTLADLPKTTHILIAGNDPHNEMLPAATVVHMEFGPNMKPPTWGAEWLRYGNEAITRHSDEPDKPLVSA